jgi:hypothetical protein
MAKLSKWQLGQTGQILLLAGALFLSPLTALQVTAASTAVSTDASTATAAHPPSEPDTDQESSPDSERGSADREAAHVASASRMVAPVNGLLSASGSSSVINPGKPGLLGQNSDPLGLSGKDPLLSGIDSKILKGNVSKNNDSPFVEGKVQSVPKGTKVELTMMHVINSEFTQKGDEIWMKVAQDVVGDNGRVMPGTWFMHGLVTEAQGRKRGNRDGYVEVQFDKIVSPDGKHEADFKATLSTKDSTMKTVAKQVFTESRYMAVGGLGGALLSLQVTGIGGAIATHGISVGVGAGIGGALGLFGSLKKYGDVASLSAGEHMKMTIVEPLEMPVFKARTFVSAKPVPKLANMEIKVNGFRFANNPLGDKRSKRLNIEVTIVNHTTHDVSARQLSVVNDYNQQFMPTFDMDKAALTKHIHPYARETILIVYEVDDAKRKYWLSLHDNSTTEELARIPVNCQ